MAHTTGGPKRDAVERALQQIEHAEWHALKPDHWHVGATALDADPGDGTGRTQLTEDVAELLGLPVYRVAEYPRNAIRLIDTGDARTCHPKPSPQSSVAGPRNIRDIVADDSHLVQCADCTCCSAAKVFKVCWNCEFKYLTCANCRDLNPVVTANTSSQSEPAARHGQASVAQMHDLFHGGRLRRTDWLVVNDIGNLAIFRDGDQIGYIQLGNATLGLWPKAELHLDE